MAKRRKRRRRALGILRGAMSETKIKSCRKELRKCLDAGRGTPRMAFGVCKRQHRRCLEGAKRA
jgi:hypothetical protein